MACAVATNDAAPNDENDVTMYQTTYPLGMTYA